MINWLEEIERRLEPVILNKKLRQNPTIESSLFEIARALYFSYQIPGFAQTQVYKLGARLTTAMYCASVAYPIKSSGVFDYDYFAKKHAPMFARLLGDNCVRFEVHKSLATPGAPVPTIIASAYFWVKSGEDFGATLEQHGEEIYADIPKFTDIEPVRGWFEVTNSSEK